MRIFLLLNIFSLTFISIQVFAESSKSDLTVMMYMAGNELEIDGTQKEVIDALVKQGPPESTNIAIYYSGTEDYRGFINKNSFDHELINKENTADPKTLTSYIEWAVSARPAKRYILILWGHGHAWKNYLPAVTPDIAPVIIQDPFGLGFMHDSVSKNEMTVHQLSKALIELKQKQISFDVLAMDMCYMASAEVLYELSEVAPEIVASEASQLQWPYAEIFSPNFAAFSNQEIGKWIVSKNYDHAIAANKEEAYVITSAIDTKLFKAFIDDDFTPFVRRLKDAHLNRSGLLTEFQKSESYDGDEDLKDFMSVLSHLSDIFPEAKLLKNNLRHSVIASQSYSEDGLDGSGMTIYAPENALINGYQELEFSKQTGWANFIDWRIQ